MAFIRGMAGRLGRARAAAWQLACLLLLLLSEHASAVNLTAVSFTSTAPTQTAVGVVYVKASESFTANLSGNTNDSSANWRGTGWRISATSGAYSCFNSTNFDTNGGSTTLPITMTAPASAGTYNVYFQAYTANTCGTTTGSAVFATAVVVVDATAPTATISCSSPASCGTANPTKQSSVSWTVTFSEAVTGLTASNFTTAASGPTGTSVTGISGSGTTYTVTASTGSGSGTVGLNMASGLTTVYDQAGNNPAAVNAVAGNTYTIDKTAPTVTSIVCTTSCGTANPTNAAQVSWTVTFSEAVTGVSTANFALVGSGTLVSVSGSGTTRTVTANTGADGTTIGLSLVVPSPPSSIVDALGTPLTTGLAATPANTYTIDKAGPVITAAAIATTVSSNMPVPSAYAKVGDTVALTFTTSGAATSPLPVVTIAGRAATVVAVSSPTTWSASQVMAVGDTEGAVAFTINVSDPIGNAATPRTTTTDGSSVTFDKTAPVATINCSNPALCGPSNVTSSTQVTWAVGFSESVTGLAAANFGFSGTLSGSTTMVGGVSGSGASYTVTASTTGTQGDLGLNLSASLTTVKDAAGNTPAAVVAADNNKYTILTQPVATITCGSPAACGAANPTNLATVSWTVTFSQSVTGVSLANFSLTGTGTSGAALTGISGSGTSWSVTATTGVNGTLGLNLSAPASITSSNGSSPLAVTATASNTYTKDSNATGECFVDDFNRASLGADWSTTSSGGSFGQPVIVGNRLRLTDNSAGVATAAHLQRLFPAAGNKVVVEFDYYGYNPNGAGADGIAVILSDGAVAPVAGAFGGSLGYAQKAASPASDCPTFGGCPGFSGGWIGVGIDEYGNFAVEGEGRIGGASSLVPNTVAVRGSGSGLSGYRYHTRSSTLSPTVGVVSATAGPGHRYRITIDHTDGVHAYVKVERDTSVNHDGYTTVVAQYDAKAETGQAAVPANWYLSYTGSTGMVTNFHELDDLKVCTTRPIALPTLHHVRIVHDGAAATCAPETVTLRACADATCSSLYLGSVEVDLSAVAGSTWSADPVTFSSGQGTVTLTKASAGNATLGGTVTSPTPTSSPVLTALQCYKLSVGGDCVLPFSAASCLFDAVHTGKMAGSPIYTRLAGTAFGIDVLALNAGAINANFVGTVTPVLVDQSSQLDSNGCGSTVLAAAIEGSIAMTSTHAGRAPFTFNYAQAAADVRVKITSGAQSACSNDNFAIRPATFAIVTGASNAAATGAPVVAAGASFSIAAMPRTLAAPTVNMAGYTGTAVFNAGAMTARSPAEVLGTLGGSFGQSSGLADQGSSGAFTYSEAGGFTFPEYGIYDASFATVDSAKEPVPDCFKDANLGTATPLAKAPNTFDENNQVACFFGAPATTFGRFIPDHFDTVISQTGNTPMACPSGQACPDRFNGAVYSRQPFTMQVIAKRFGATTAANDGVVTNYNNTATYARDVTLSAWSLRGSNAQDVPAALQNPPAAPANSALGVTAIPRAAFVGGVASLNGGAGLADLATQTYSFGGGGYSAGAPTAVANWVAPTTVYIRATESGAVDNVGSDGVSSRRAVPATSEEAGILVLSGRLLVPHVYGSERLRLRVPVLAQYWNGTRWVTSYVDNVSAFGSAAVARANYRKGLGDSNTLVVGQASAPLVKGAGQFFMQAAGAGVSGSVDFSIGGAGAPVWLPSTVGRSRVGTYRSPLIYIRELY